MMKVLMRYRALLLLLLVQACLVLGLPDIGREAVGITGRNLLEMLAVIPPIFVLLGLLDVWVDRETMIRFTGKGSGIRGALIAFLIGSAAAGPLYAAFPVAAVMLKKGTSFINVLLFIGAWSTTKIPMLTFEAANLGFKFTLLRLGLSITGILLIAAVTDKILSHEEKEAIRALNES